jgi:uncharacterized membrane protein
MAEEKKPPSQYNNLFEEVVWLLAGLLLLSAILARLQSYFSSQGINSVSEWFSNIFEILFGRFWAIWQVIAIIFCVVCVLWIIYSLRRLKEIDEEEEKIFGANPEDTFITDLVEEVKESQMSKEVVKGGKDKWERVLAGSISDNPADWRVAIIEADVILEELLRALGYPGDGVGEMLKNVQPGDMVTLENAWEAHKIRNQIAHGGGNFQLTSREAKRVIALFESVFREFEMA